MSVIIKDMEFPKNCYECSFRHWEEAWDLEEYLVCELLNKEVKEGKRHKKCPLVEVVGIDTKWIGRIYKEVKV